MGGIAENWPVATALIHRAGMSPEHCDDLLGDVWDCDLEQDAARDSERGRQDLLEELVFDLVDAP
jgi:hypothetical protein